jgi:hypothetical protein
MKEIPMLFSTPMVQAILEGRKTQTRRLIKEPVSIDKMGNLIMGGLNYGQDFNGPAYWNLIKCKSSWQPGDLLWVRESWQLKGWDFEEGTMTVQFATGEKLNCKAYDPTDDSEWLMNQVDKLETKGYIKPDPRNNDLFVFTDKAQPFHPSIHMPKEAARIWLQVTDVRVERLHDISDADAIAEGVEMIKGGAFPYKHYGSSNAGCSNAIASFESLWREINGDESWDTNPWVWAINFKVLSTTGKPVISLTEKA